MDPDTKEMLKMLVSVYSLLFETLDIKGYTFLIVQDNIGGLYYQEIYFLDIP